MANAKSMIPHSVLLEKIYEIRGQKVMLDRDLATLYGVRNIRLREQVKRNKGRFPPNFMLQLTDKDVELMVSQKAIPSIQHLGGYLPYAFTEHGVLMLANVLKSTQALKMSVRIIEVFVNLREAILSSKEIFLKLEQLDKQTFRHDKDIQLLFRYLKELLTPKVSGFRKIGFKQKYTR